MNTKKPTVPGNVGTHPLSRKDYLLLFAGIIVVGLIMVGSFLWFAPAMARTGIAEKFYYIVLVVWGIIAALVVGGYAHIVLKKPGLFIELGGAAAVLMLVVVGGYILVPHAVPFHVVVRPHADGNPVIASGKVRLEYGANPAERYVDSTGDADFREIPPEYAGRTVKVLPEVDGYKQEYSEVTLDPSKPVIDLVLVKETPETHVTGTIVPPQKGRQVKILVEGETAEAVPDEYGRFGLTVHKKSTERARFSVWVGGRRVYDDLQPLSGPVNLILKK